MNCKKFHLGYKYGLVMATLPACLLASFCAIAQVAADEPETAQEEILADTQADERELMAEEDPLAAKEIDKEKRETFWYDVPNTVRTYGSVRVRYRDTGLGPVWGDGGSRAGIESHWQMMPKRWILGGYEAGFNILDSIDQIIDPGSASREGGKNIFTRLAYIGFDGPNLIALYGKNWSTYYKVASLTDRFQGTGSSASGVYNARTDGGATGTGRADGVLQARLHIDFFPDDWNLKPFNINLQYQHGEPVPAIDNINYGKAFGISAVLNTKDDYTLGIAYNYAEIPDASNPAVLQAGIDGDVHALVIGTRWYGDKYYLGVITTRLENHETTDTSTYFDGTGGEIYGQYNVHGPWWIIAGYNALIPDSDQSQAGQYKIDYGVLGVRYSIDGFQPMIYFNARIDNGRLTDGSSIGNIYTVGIRWDLETKSTWLPLRHP